MTDLVLVTAFYDIGRGDSKTHRRTNNDYFHYFERWARIYNDIIVFCEDDCIKQTIVNILSKTKKKGMFKVINLGKKEDYNKEIYLSMKEVEVSPIFKEKRISPPNIEDTADYCYLMYLKFFLMKKALEYIESPSPSYLAWIDFGYEHGGDLFKTKKDYNFEWKFNFLKRIVLFEVSPLDLRPIDVIASNTINCCIAGSPFILPLEKVNIFVDWIEESYRNLLNSKLIDDDQTFLLDVYRKHPLEISLVPSRFFLAMNQFGGKLRIKKVRANVNYFFKIVRRIKRLFQR